MKPSRYLEKFLALAEESANSYELIGDCILVERIPEDEMRTKGGIILTQSFGEKQVTAITADKPNWMRVLAVGEGYYSEGPDGQDISVPLNVSPGDIVLVSRVGVKLFSLFGALEGYESDSIGITRESEIQLRFKGEEGYRQAFATLNKTTKKQVEP